MDASYKYIGGVRIGFGPMIFDKDVSLAFI